MTTATDDARSVVQSFYANLAGGKPDAAFALCSDDIEWNEAEGNPLADRNPYRGVKQIAEGVLGRLGAIFEGFAAVPDEFIAENRRVIVLGPLPRHAQEERREARLPGSALVVGRRGQDRALPAVRGHRPALAPELASRFRHANPAAPRPARGTPRPRIDTFSDSPRVIPETRC
jgi:ketosteroid isomerase-like protein